MKSELIMQQGEDLVCSCPICGASLDKFKVVDGEHKGTIYYSCRDSSWQSNNDKFSGRNLCTFTHIKEHIVLSYQKKINALREIIKNK